MPRRFKNDQEIQLQRSFSECLKKAMNRKGVSLKSLSEKTGIHENLIYQWLKAKVTPGLYNLVRIINFFDDGLLFEVGDQTYIIDRLVED